MVGLIVLFLVAWGVVVAGVTLSGLRFLTHPRRVTFATMIAKGMPASPGDMGLVFEERVLKARDGVSIRAWRVEGKEPGGPVVVMSHGWADSRFGMLTPMQTFVPVASVIWMYDLRGQGESPVSGSRLGTMEVEDLLDVLEVVHQENPGKKIVLAGYSMGAGISIAASARAAQDPERFGTMAGVIWDGGYRKGMQPIEGYAKLKGLPMWPFMFFIKQHLSFWYMKDHEFDRVEHAKRMKCPILLMHGDLDEVCPIEAAREVAAAAGGGSRLEVFEGAGHLDLYVREPERYEGLVAGFVREVGS